MRSVPVVAVEPCWQISFALLRRLVFDGVSPFPDRRLHEALGLAVGLGRVGFGAQVLDAEIGAGFGKGARAIALAIIGHDAIYADAKALVKGKGGPEMGNGAFFFLVREDV